MKSAEEPQLLSRPDRTRQANDRVAAEAERRRFVSRLPVLCECSDSGCNAIFLVPAEDYRRVRSDPRDYLTAPGHLLGDARPHARRADWWVQRKDAPRGADPSLESPTRLYSSTPRMRGT